MTFIKSHAQLWEWETLLIDKTETNAYINWFTSGYKCADHHYFIGGHSVLACQLPSMLSGAVDGLWRSIDVRAYFCQNSCGCYGSLWWRIPWRNGCRSCKNASVSLQLECLEVQSRVPRRNVKLALTRSRDSSTYSLLTDILRTLIDWQSTSSQNADRITCLSSLMQFSCVGTSNSSASFATVWFR